VTSPVGITDFSRLLTRIGTGGLGGFSSVLFTTPLEALGSNISSLVISKKEKERDREGTRQRINAHNV